jgi:hypothetical protein
MGLDEPIASIRLELLRRGSEDYEYLWLLSHKHGGKEIADDVVNTIIHNFAYMRGAMGSPAMWNHNPEEWERARIRMGDLIAKSLR